MMLNEQSIREALTDLASHLRANLAEEAESDLDVLNFGRLLIPIRSRAKGSSDVIDPAADFGRERVLAVSHQLESVRRALTNGDSKAAIDAAEIALTRWISG